MAAEWLQYGGSLAAVVVLVLVACALRLGAAPEIASEAEARELADDTLCGFDAETVALDRDGRGALLRDRAGRVMLLAPHGNRFVGRMLDARASARIENGRLTVATGERRLAPASLRLADPETWCRTIEALD